MPAQLWTGSPDFVSHFRIHSLHVCILIHTVLSEDYCGEDVCGGRLHKFVSHLQPLSVKFFS